MAAWQRSRLFGYWKELSASVAADYTDRADPERAARLAYATEKLGTPIESWSKLGMGQAGKLIAAMRKDLHRDDEDQGIRHGFPRYELDYKLSHPTKVKRLEGEKQIEDLPLFRNSGQ